MNKKIIWTAEMDDKLRELYPTTPATDLADLFGCTPTTVIYHARKLGLNKDSSFSSHDYYGRYTKRCGKFNIYK